MSPEPPAPRHQLPELPENAGLGARLVRYALPVTLMILAVLVALLTIALLTVPEEVLREVFAAVFQRLGSTGGGGG